MSEPTPPTPPVPPVPRYGEYAPGFVPPAPDASAPESGTPQPYGAASYPQQDAPRGRRTWDVVLSVILLIVGLFGMLIGVAYGALFTDPALLDEAFRQQGFDGFHGTVGAAAGVLIVSHLVLYLVAVAGTIPLLLTKRIAFWVPLVAGVIAAIVFWGTLFSVILTDPTLVSQVGGVN
ncbi:MAG TPA: DUF6264 family protein [Pseudolysinimonas sp.]|nr:DUF6264 family protein [Pseudolysinimonas sp.]